MQDALADILGDEEHATGSEAASLEQTSAMLSASLGTLGSTTATNKKPVARGKRKKAEDDAASSVAAISGVRGKEASDFLVQLQRSDPEMAKVCAKHEALKGGVTATCLGKLDVCAFLRGAKLGQALTGVGVPPNLCKLLAVLTSQEELRLRQLSSHLV